MSLKCTKCGAGIEDLTVDAHIIVTFRIDDKGRINRLKTSLPEEELCSRALDAGEQHTNMFCDKCGHYMGIEYDNDGYAIQLNDSPPRLWISETELLKKH